MKSDFVFAGVIGVVFVIVGVIDYTGRTERVPSAPPGSISRADLWVACKQKSPGVRIELTDDNYFMPSPGLWRRYVDILPTRKYRIEQWDCDDYAIETWFRARLLNSQISSSVHNTGIAVGFIAYNHHAANVIRLSDGRLIVWDAQRRVQVAWPANVDYIWF